MTTETPQQPAPKPRRFLKRVLLAFGVLVVLIAITLGAVLWGLAHLDNPAIKTRILGTVARKFGVELDYDQARITLGSLHLTGLRIYQPPPDGRSAPPLLAVDHVDATLSLLGEKPTVHTLTVSGIHATIFADEDGTSIDRLVARLPKSQPSPSKPLSETLAHMGNLPVTVESARIDGVDAQLIRRQAGKIVEKTSVSGLGATLSAVDHRLELAIATPSQGAPVAISDQRDAGTRQLRASAHLDVLFDGSGPSPRDTIALESTLQHQSFVALPARAPSIEQVVSLHATLAPDPVQHRTTVSIEKLALLGDAGTGTMNVALKDDPSGAVKPYIHSASLELALDRLRGFLPASVGELNAPASRLKLTAVNVDLSKGVRLDPDGSVELLAQVPEFDWRRAGDVVHVESARLEAHGTPTTEGMAILARLPLGQVKATLNGQSIDLSKLALSVKSEISRKMEVNGKIALSFERIETKARRSHLRLQSGTLGVALKDARFTIVPTFEPSGSFTVDGQLADVATESRSLSVHVRQMKVNLPVGLESDGRMSMNADLAADSFACRQAGRVLLAPTRTHFALQLRPFKIDRQTPKRTAVDARMDLMLGAMTAKAHLDKSASNARFDISAKSANLGWVRPFVRALDRAYQIPWKRMAVSLQSRGSITGLFAGRAMRIDHDTTLRVERASVRGRNLDVGARLLSAHITSKGTAAKHAGDANLRVSGLALDGRHIAGDEDVKLHLAFDRSKPVVDLHVEGSGAIGPDGDLGLSLKFDGAHRRLSYVADGHLSQLGLVPMFLPPAIRDHERVDWAKLALSIKGRGNVEDVIRRFKGGLTPVLASNPMQVLRGTQALDLTLEGVQYANDAEQSANLSSVGLHVNALEKGDRRVIDASLNIPQGRIVASGARMDLKALQPALRVETSDETGQAHLHMTLAQLDQTFYPAYPVGDASLDVTVSGDAQGTLQVKQARLENPAGGTTLDITGGIESLLEPGGGLHWRKHHVQAGVPGRSSMTLTGKLTQRMESLPKDAGLSGTGTVAIPFHVESGDLRFFRTAAAIQFDHASISLPSQKLFVDQLNARIPIKQEFVYDKHGLVRLGGVEPNAYPRERFFDYQPFLGSDYFLSVGTVRMGDHEVGPIVGNLRINRNVIALDQLAMSALGGRITGQCILNYDPADPEATEVLFRGDVTGIATPGSKSDTFDANAAFRFNPRRMELEGRTEIVRIGRAHLLELLDLWDPYHANVSANEVREALKVGYPKQVRLRFHQGFAGLSIDLGGVAGAVGLGEIRGLPTGPLLERYLGPFLVKKKKEQP